MKSSPRRALALAVATSLVLCAAAPAMAGQVYLDNLKPNGHYSRFIVGYVPGSAPTQAPQNLRSSLNAAASRAALPASLKQGLGLKPVRAMILSGARVVATDAALDRGQTETLMRQIAADPNVAFVQIDELQTEFAVPNDPDLSKQWHYADSAAGIRAPSAWSMSTGSGIVVAVIDSGIYATHTDLAANLLPGYDFIDTATGYGQQCVDAGKDPDCGASGDGDARDPDPEDSTKNGHGSHVAGTVAAVGNNAKGGLGVAYNAKLLPLRVSGKGGSSMSSNVADAIVWASGGSVSGVPANPNRADVMNLSLGNGKPCSAMPAYQAAIAEARANGTVVVVAAGNSNKDVANYSPASCDGAISVAATNKSGKRASYSNFGATIDVTAPGGENSLLGPSATDGVISTVAGNKYGPLAGTSMASPHVAGIAALIQAAAPAKLSPDKVEQILKSTARPIAAKNCSGGCGAGLVDAAAAVQAARTATP
ncbi:S8 family serine peptidase [Lysobacter enzymogenes]|uniref:S8 family serine peptidase n=1 Tax=Lysobacter enzymogenes TaxID=69 RepID=UPI001A9790DB|nr:S8 family serine peptidase [Lysobacter enzymogenes]QQP98289.1 S8 family serine peptidase [Lysobacter enzymogenes]